MKSICGTSLKGAVVAAALLALLVLPTAPQSYAAEKDQKQQATTTGIERHESGQELLMNKRIAQGYSVIGPLELMGASSSQLVIGAEPGKAEVTVSLAKKKVSVMDEAGNPLTISSVKKGLFAIICQKKDEVIIYVLQKTKKETGNAN